VAAIDLNHDGVLGADEIAKASETLRQMDKDGDGTLTAAELRPNRAVRPRPAPPVASEQAASEPAQRPAPKARLGALDLNKDGFMDANEINGATQALAKLDKDGDGKVTQDELRAQPARRPRASRDTVPAAKE
jgi:hypothetical protein